MTICTSIPRICKVEGGEGSVSGGGGGEVEVEVEVTLEVEVEVNLRLRLRINPGSIQDQSRIKQGSRVVTRPVKVSHAYDAFE
jgi:hypothetical protein